MRPSRVLLALLVLVLASAAHAIAGDLQLFRSPNGLWSAHVIPLAKSPTATEESWIAVYSADGEVLVSQGYGSLYGEHGYGVRRAAWTPDSRFFVYSLSSSGGHQAWHFRTDFIDVETGSVRRIDDYIGPITDPEFSISPPDTVHVIQWLDGAAKAETLHASLSSLVPRTDVAYSGWRINPPDTIRDSGTLASGASYQLLIVERPYVPVAGATTDDWSTWGIDGGYPTNVPQTFSIRINGTELHIPRKLYQDICDVNTVAIDESNGDVKLTIMGSDAAGSYEAEYIFREGWLIERTVHSGEFYNEFWEKTIIHSEELPDSL